MNYLRVDPLSLLRLRDLWVRPTLLIALASWLGDVGLPILPPAALSYLLTAVMVGKLDKDCYAVSSSIGQSERY